MPDARKSKSPHFPFLFRSLLFVLIYFVTVQPAVEAQPGKSRQSSTLRHISLPECARDHGSPNLTCQIRVPNLQEDLFAVLEGQGCQEALSIPAGVKNFIVEYSITDSQQEDIRLVGTVKNQCPIPVTEAEDCDAEGNPFLGLECKEVHFEGILRSCRRCAAVKNALCYQNLSDDSVELVIQNANDCPHSIVLSYLIAAKAKKSVEVEGHDYFLQYLVDPTVVQEPNCPAGCPPPPPPP